MSARASSGDSARAALVITFGAGTRSTALMVSRPKSTPADSTWRSVTRTSATVFDARPLDSSSACQVAARVAVRAMAFRSPSVDSIRRMRSTYRPNELGLTRWRALVSSHQRASSPTVVAAQGSGGSNRRETSANGHERQHTFAQLSSLE